MNVLRRELRLFLMLLIFWIILAGETTLRQLITGILSSMLAIVIYNWTLRNSGADRVNWIPLRKLLYFGSVMLSEILLSTLPHLRRIIEGNGETAICRLQLAVEEELIVTLIANAITLTPGTVTLEADHKILTVLFYGNMPNQCPLDLVLMAEHLQKPFVNPRIPSFQEVEHA